MYSVYIDGERRYNLQSWNAGLAWYRAYSTLARDVLECAGTGATASEVFAELRITLKVVNTTDPTDTYEEALF
jgi:hypothetical protein